MLTNEIKLHKDYVEIKVKSKTYSATTLIDIEDLTVVGKIRVSNTGYAYQSKRKGKSIAGIILGVETNRSLLVDHINGDTLDNRKANLRLVTASENCRNRHSFSRNNTGIVGIQYRDRRKDANPYYRVSLTDTNGKRFCKHFNCAKLGKQQAFSEAKKCLVKKQLEFGYIVQPHSNDQSKDVGSSESKWEARETVKI